MSELLGQDYLTRNYLMLRQHTVITEDSFLSIGLTFKEPANFFQVANIVPRKQAKRIEPNKLYESILMLHEEKHQHERKIYGLIDLLGDLGGVLEVVTVVFGIILYPISFHSFILELSNRIFLART